jgi:hypothetical protein
MSNLNQKLTSAQIKAGVLGVCWILVPLFFAMIYQNNPIVHFIFGNGRIFIFWALTGFLMYKYLK